MKAKIIIGLAALLITACSNNELSKSEAKKQLQELCEQHPPQLTIKLGKVKGTVFKSPKEQLEKLSQAGLITYEEIHEKYQVGEAFNVELTSEAQSIPGIELRNDMQGKPIAVIPTYRVKIEGIEAIRYAEEDKEKTIAAVFYTQSLTPISPLISKYAELNGEDDSELQSRAAQFKRTEKEGWKIIK